MNKKEILQQIKKDLNLIRNHDCFEKYCCSHNKDNIAEVMNYINEELKGKKE